LAPSVVCHPDNPNLLDSGVFEDRSFDFAGSDAISAGEYEVVVAGFEPDVARFVDRPEVASQMPLANRRVGSFFWLIPVFLKYHWVVSTTNRYLPGFACRTFLAGFGVDDGHIVSGDRFTHAPRLDRKPFPAVCYEEIRFRLAVEFVYNDTGEFIAR